MTVIGVLGDVEVPSNLGDDISVKSISSPSDVDGTLAYLVIGLSSTATAAALPPAFDKARDLRIPTAIVVDELEPWLLTDVWLRYDNVQEVFDSSTITSLGNRILETARRRVLPGEGLRIGELQRMPGIPDDYERRRFLSFVSPSMAEFLRDLRSALGQMDRELPPMPWDPREEQPPTRIENGVPRGSGPFNLSELIQHAREPWAREILAGPTKHDAWAQLPPALLLLGESGTGKTLAATLIHQHLTRGAARRGELVEVTAAAMDTRNFDYDLFGATSGVWHNVDYRVGAITQAAYGTVFFDEIGDMPLDAQTRLLTFFNDLKARVQGAQAFFTYTHVLAATNRDLAHGVGKGSFRHDLLARFRSRVTLPPLRSRTETEIRRLVDFVAQNPLENPRLDANGQEASDGQLLVSHIALDAMEKLAGHQYADGNFREMEEAVHTAIWRARRANDRTLRLQYVDVRPQRFRPDADERVIRVRTLPVPPEDRVVFVESLDELARLATIRDQNILRAANSYAVIAGGVHYRFDNDEEPTRPD